LNNTRLGAAELVLHFPVPPPTFTMEDETLDRHVAELNEAINLMVHQQVEERLRELMVHCTSERIVRLVEQQQRTIALLKQEIHTLRVTARLPVASELVQ
jgi:tRNA(Leu) C34 or U34 (ribose-2'-O)-methylase TrmL